MANSRRPDLSKRELANAITLYSNLMEELGSRELINDEYEILFEHQRQLKGLESNPESDIQLSNHSAIVLFFQALYKLVKFTKDDIPAILKRVTKGLELRHKGKRYIASMPAALCFLFTEYGEMDIVEASADVWNHNKKLRNHSLKRRDNRAARYKAECSAHHFADFEKDGEKLRKAYEDRSGAEDRLIEFVVERRSQRPEVMITLPGETYKPTTGGPKAPRFSCGSRFIMGEGTLKTNNLGYSYGLERCAEVMAYYAREAKYISSQMVSENEN
ncbi:hypothetical protein GGR51DRAFT_522092 [Nemania sp. FL0031]|nr:hypothetical protein GGR51DRAFT_522092 [Nemania sp. FL0031]